MSLTFITPPLYLYHFPTIEFLYSHLLFSFFLSFWVHLLLAFLNGCISILEQLGVTAFFSQLNHSPKWIFCIRKGFPRANPKWKAIVILKYFSHLMLANCFKNSHLHFCVQNAYKNESDASWSVFKVHTTLAFLNLINLFKCLWFQFDSYWTCHGHVGGQSLK